MTVRIHSITEQAACDVCHYTCRIQHRPQRPLHVGAGQSSWLFLRASPGAQAQQPLHVGRRRSSWLFLRRRSGAQALRRAGQSPCPIRGAQQRAQAWWPLCIRLGGHPILSLGAHAGSQAQQLPPCQAGWSPHPFSGRPLGTQSGSLSTSGQAVILAVFPGHLAVGLRLLWPLCVRAQGGHPVPSSGRPQGAQARALSMSEPDGHPVFPQAPRRGLRPAEVTLPALLSSWLWAPAGCHLSTSAPASSWVKRAWRGGPPWLPRPVYVSV